MIDFCFHLEQADQTMPSGAGRPDWCIFGKQNQNVETLLFKGKFYDWPGDLQELKPASDTTNNVTKTPSSQRVRFSCRLMSLSHVFFSFVASVNSRYS